MNDDFQEFPPNNFNIILQRITLQKAYKDNDITFE